MIGKPRATMTCRPSEMRAVGPGRRGRAYRARTCCSRRNAPTVDTPVCAETTRPSTRTSTFAPWSMIARQRVDDSADGDRQQREQRDRARPRCGRHHERPDRPVVGAGGVGGTAEISSGAARRPGRRRSPAPGARALDGRRRVGCRSIRRRRGEELADRRELVEVGRQRAARSSASWGSARAGDGGGPRLAGEQLLDARETVEVGSGGAATRPGRGARPGPATASTRPGGPGPAGRSRPATMSSSAGRLSRSGSGSQLVASWGSARAGDGSHRLGQVPAAQPVRAPDVARVRRSAPRLGCGRLGRLADRRAFRWAPRLGGSRRRPAAGRRP